jgi:Gas vesicle synthesis protein GvpO
VHVGELVQQARRQVSELTGLQAETVVGLNPAGDDRWAVTVEVLELARVPSTMDVLGTFEVTLSADGALLGFRRLGHRRRSSTEDGGN